MAGTEEVALWLSYSGAGRTHTWCPCWLLGSWPGLLASSLDQNKNSFLASCLSISDPRQHGWMGLVGLATASSLQYFLWVSRPLSFHSYLYTPRRPLPRPSNSFPATQRLSFHLFQSITCCKVTTILTHYKIFLPKLFYQTQTFNLTTRL